MNGLGISLYSLPLLLSIITFALVVRKLNVSTVRYVPAAGFLIAAVLLFFLGVSGSWVAGVFALFAMIQVIAIKNENDHSKHKLVFLLYILQGVFAVETLLSTSAFSVFLGLQGILAIQALRNYLSTNQKQMPSLEMTSYWVIFILSWTTFVLNPQFTFQLEINNSIAKSVVLFLAGSSFVFTFFQLVPWKGYRNLIELSWNNTMLMFHLLLQAKLLVSSEFFFSQLFVGDYIAHAYRWILFLLPLLALFMVSKSTDTLRRIIVSNYFAASLLLLTYSALPQKTEHVLTTAIFSFAICMLIQNYAFKTGGDSLTLGENFRSRIFFILSLFLPLAPLSGALRIYYPEIYTSLFQWGEYATLFYFPSLLTILFMIVSAVNALILCNDKLGLSHQDIWVLRKSDVVAAFLLLPFIFLGIYPSPLYNYIQKLFIFP